MENPEDQLELINICLNNDYYKLSTMNIDPTILKGTNFFIPKEPTLFNLGTADSDYLPLNSISLLHVAAYADSFEVFLYLLEIGIPIDIVSAESYLPIHYACMGGSSEVCLYILQQRPDLASTQFSVKYDLITLATRSNSYIIVKGLFDHGADMKDPLVVSNNPLQYAISYEKIDIFKLLLAKSYSSQVIQNQPLLHIAIAYKSIDFISILLKSGENPNAFVDGLNPLHLACLNNLPKAVSILCSYMVTVEPADIENSIYGSRPVHWGCQSYSPEIISILLDHGMKVNALDDSGNSGPTYLTDHDNDDNIIEILEILYKAGLDLEAGSLTFLKKNHLEIKNKNGCYPKSILASFVFSFSKRIKPIKWLLEHGADPYSIISTDKHKNIPLIDYVMNIMSKSKSYQKLIPIFQPYLH